MLYGRLAATFHSSGATRGAGAAGRSALRMSAWTISTLSRPLNSRFQKRDQLPVHLDGQNPGALLGQKPRQRSAPGPTSRILASGVASTR